MISVFGRLLVWSIKAAWGIGKVLFSLVFLPLMLIGMVCSGLLYLAIVILAICGVVVFIGSVIV
jgi:hypothetical protein